MLQKFYHPVIGLRYLFFCISLSFFSGSFNSASAQIIKTKDLNKNYNSVLFPNTSDIVGAVFAIDKDNKMKRITQLSVKPQPNDIVVGDYTKTKNFTWSMILNLLGVSGSKLSGDAKLGGTSNLVEKISYKQTKQYTMDVLAANDLIQQKRAELQRFAEQNDLKKMKFYLIIENITAKQVDYGLTRTATTKDSINTKLNQIGSVGAGISYDGSRGYQIHYNLPQELCVLYSTIPLNPPVAQLSGDKFMLEVGKNPQKTIVDITTLHE